jgi:isoaspartyl peptidase/L-asparaginase-like protein (Ntn-hydrolase superfamily)
MLKKEMLKGSFKLSTDTIGIICVDTGGMLPGTIVPVGASWAYLFRVGLHPIKKYSTKCLLSFAFMMLYKHK